MSEPYKIETLGAHKMGRILTAAGDVVEIDQTSQKYGDFLRWMSEQTSGSMTVEGYGQLEPHAVYLCEKAALIEHCKSHAIILYVAAGDDPDLVRGNLITISHSGETEVRGSCEQDKSIIFSSVFSARPIDGPVASYDGLTLHEPVFYVSRSLFAEISEDLRQENSDIRKLSSWPVERTFVYVDVSEFSQHPTGHQLSIITWLINAINAAAQACDRRDSKVSADMEASLCIGDGYICVFRTPHFAAYFSAYLAAMIEHMIASERVIDFHFRISVHSGPVYRFWDRGVTALEGRWNYIGTGITVGQRVLSAIGKDKDDVVYISAETRKRMLMGAEPNTIYDGARWLQNRGRHSDKHRTKRRLYEVDHVGWTTFYNVMIPGKRWPGMR